jgi:hypothetical protein
MVDLLSSGPPRPRRIARIWRRRRVRVAVAVLVAVAALVVLRFTVGSTRSAVDPPAAAATTTPVGPATPLDRLPGRTPIPEPAQTRDLLSGPLPVLGGSSEVAARRAAGLVVGRYCVDLTRFSVAVDPATDGRNADWRHVLVLVTDRLYTDSGPAMQLRLEWDVRTYRWFGPLTLLRGC